MTKVNNMKNPSLYESLISLTQKSLEVIRNNIDKKLVKTTESAWVKQDNDTYVRQNINRPLWGIVFNKVKTEIEATGEFVNFSAVLKAEQTISPQLNTLVGTCMGRSSFKIDNLVFMPLSPFLTDTGISAFDESVFKTEYLKLEHPR